MAANHTKLIGLGVGAILAISAAPMYAVARHPSADTLKPEARNFVKIISGDKRKSQTYCKIVELNDQIDEKEDPIDARKLKKKRDKFGQSLQYSSRSTSCVRLSRTSIADERVRSIGGDYLTSRGSATTARGRQSLAARYRHDGGDQAAPIRRRASRDLVS